MPVYVDTSGCCVAKCCVAIATQQRDVSTYTGIHQMRCTAYEVAPDDGVTESETCRASNGKLSLITRIFVHLVGLYTHYRKRVMTNTVSLTVVLEY